MQKGRVTLRVAGGIPYELTRKKVKYFNLHVRRDGSVALSSPLRISPEAADHYIIGQMDWIRAAQARQAVASGTMEPGVKTAQPVPEAKPDPEPTEPETPQPELPRPAVPPLPLQARNAVRELHARWAAEEADLRRSQPEFRLQEELKNPEMRRLMQLPGMRMQDAYRLAHYDESLHRAAQAVEQGVVQRIQQRAARPAENGIRPGGAATVHPDVASMTRAQREALERRVLHGAQIEL